MADADLAVILDGQGHVITRDAGESFPAKPELLNTVRKLRYTADICPNSRSTTTANQPGDALVPQDHAGENDGATYEDSLLPAVMQLVPIHVLLMISLSTSLAASTERFPGQ